MYRFQAAWIPPADLPETLAALGQVRGGPQIVTLPEVEIPQLPSGEEDLSQRLQDLGWDIDGSYNSAFLALFPGQAPGGSKWYEVKAAVDQLRTTTTTPESPETSRDNGNGRSPRSSSDWPAAWLEFEEAR